ncbi:hypothetical protein PITC_062900 [Penicillium italicum]|uniref:Uncharacterized protein n=1 Tax=Penicillium italicum TaxID=40296 RepID=A0A0A2L3W9_PENIT|nr:hypothetical protein PITC_062900 [Penicillium italicum]
METSTNYLSLPAIAEFINAYEDKPTAENVKIMVSGLLTYAFDSNDGWVLKWQEDEENNHSNCFIVRAVGEERSLHAIVKVILDTSGAIEENWDQSIPRLLSAPLPNERCWAILFRGLKFRFYEYHREQQSDERLVPCDFKLKDKSKHAVHIRKNADAINNVLISIPSQIPEPLEEGEHSSPAPNDSATETTNGSKVSLDVTLDTAPASGAYLESFSEDTPTEVSEENTPTKAEPVTEREAAAQADTTTSQTKHTTEANGTKAKITPQAKAAILAKAAAGIKSTTHAKTAAQVKPAAGVKNTTQAKTKPHAKAALLAKGVSEIKLNPKIKPAVETEVAGRTATE